MVRALGIDPGTGSMDLLAFDDETGEVFYAEAIPRRLVTEDPSIVIERLMRIHRAYGLDAIVAPSGYGMPLKRVQEASDADIRLATFITCEDEERGLQIVGLRRLMQMFRDSDLPAWFTPGGVHLPSIPAYRKANRIDMATADKIFTVAAAMAAERLGGARPENINIIVVEIGQAYTSAMLVEESRITDAIAGTAGFWGFMGGGFMDSELAYALAAVRPRFSKKLLFSGGVSSIYGISGFDELEEGLGRGVGKAREAANMLAEGVVKAASALVSTARKRPTAIYLSGRAMRYPLISRMIVEGLKRSPLLSDLPAKRPLLLSPTAKEGASGAAIIASGLAGGAYRWVVDSLGLRESSGHVFSWVVDEGLKRDLVDEFASTC
ncbi:MAG: DUF1464 family protein [Desulfurococcales archaeon]|nr:DUF1464 family protein [Desulfurococcales archaeon]